MHFCIFFENQTLLNRKFNDEYEVRQPDRPLEQVHWGAKKQIDHEIHF